MMETFSVIKRNPESAARVREILGIPESQEWSELKVEFGLDEVGTCTVTFLLEAQQTVDFAMLAFQQIDMGIIRDRAIESISEDLLGEARASVALDGDTRS